VLRGLRQLLVGGQGGRLDDPGAVQAAAGAAAGGGGALEPLQDRLPVAAARVVRAGDDLRAGDGDAGDPFAFEHAAVALRRRLEEVAPDDVAGHEARSWRWEESERVRGHVLRRAGRLREPVGEPAEPADPELEGLERSHVLDAQRPGWMDRMQGGDVLLL